MVFPTDVSSSVPRLRHPAKEEWSCLLRKVKPFIVRLRADRVLMFWMLPEMFGKMAKENTDVRLGYQVDKHTFLVKAYSTFGGRTEASNTSHIIQTTVVCMLFYRVPKGFYADEDVPEWSFLYEDQFMYEKYVLQPNSAYCVPSGTQYLTMTCQKTLFSIHVVSPDAALPELNLLSPTSTRKLNATQTPMNMYRDDKKSKFKRLKTCTDAQQQHVSTDPQQQQQPLSYLVLNETNQFLPSLWGN
ncbi:uncharacterized protein CDAR_251981 [Caerostris darwini]|uniref:Uncharacterized protein n=1 Tax=Caerostris darwini TaxID=1538125 RepID=A0AAV4VEH3_9ARAC|nr:uncharacterized protein CDAR_251981 [Caerostris darwini]